LVDMARSCTDNSRNNRARHVLQVKPEAFLQDPKQ